jgi:hypothetical protein
MKKLITPEFRVSFPYLFKPNAFQEGKEPKYSVTMLFDKKANLKPLKQLMMETIKEKWGSNPPKGLRKPFRKGSEKELQGYDDDTIFMTCSSKMKVGLVDQARQPIIHEDDFYAGCYAHASVTCYAYDNQFGKGVSFGLQNVQKLRDGEPFSGRTKPEDDFEILEADDAFDAVDVDSEDDDDIFGDDD